MPSTEDWRSALSRAETSPRKPSAPSLLSGRIEHLRDSTQYQVDAAQRRAEFVKGALDYSMLTRASSPSQYSVAAQSTPRSPTRSATATLTSLASAALVHPLAAPKPSSKSIPDVNASPPRAKLYVRTTATPRQEEAVYSGKTRVTPGIPKATAVPAPAQTSLSDSTVELNEIKQSVERLRAQRSHVEQLGGENERLKAQLAQQEVHNERLRDELARVQGLSQENIGLLQTVKLLEERTRTLEGICHDKRSELRKASEQLAGVDQERQQLLLTMEGIEQDHTEVIKAHVAEQSRLRERLAQLERKYGVQQSRDREWSEKLQAAEGKLAAVKQEHEAELEQHLEDKQRLRDAVEELEQQVQKLLATTVRQTAIIEDCDRALSEAKHQHVSVAESCEDQRRVIAELNVHMQKLETRAASIQRGWDDDKIRSEKLVMELESKLAKRRNKLEALRGALQDRDQQLQEMQRDQLLRDRSRFHSDEVNKELKKREQALQSEVSELRIALRDMTDEKTLVSDRVLELQERLETEQKDRQRWATARLKLLAEFCDEENKLTSALQHRGTSRRHSRRHDRQEESSSVSSADHLVWSHELDASGASDDSGKHHERRRGSIVFG